jgi:murein DD-endopeptidase MepM/ murein hydrolase activator NlpD
MRFFKFLTAAFLLTFIFTSSSFADNTDDKPKKKKINASIELLSVKVGELKTDSKYAFNPAVKWLPLMKLVRAGQIERQAAIDSMYKLTNSLWDYMAELGGKKYGVDEWVFPVKGYTPSAIGGSNGSGYQPANFDFFDLNTGGHPAHDIFIHDKDQDFIDDATGKHVEILSMSGGIVVETRKNWVPSMDTIKGGNIVYVYDNYTNGLFYYAHMHEVAVDVGDIVKPGTVLGTMGRTGKNAYPRRSPTHLHIMYVRSHDGELIAEDIYKDLLNARLVP